jgi:hypothetical protein
VLTVNTATFIGLVAGVKCWWLQDRSGTNGIVGASGFNANSPIRNPFADPLTTPFPFGIRRSAFAAFVDIRRELYYFPVENALRAPLSKQTCAR